MTTIPVTRGDTTKNLSERDLLPALARLDLGIPHAGRGAQIAGLGKFTRAEITALLDQLRTDRSAT